MSHAVRTPRPKPGYPQPGSWLKVVGPLALLALCLLLYPAVQGGGASVKPLVTGLLGPALLIVFVLPGLLIHPRRIRLLVANGVPTRGTVTVRREVSGTTAFTFTYEVEDKRLQNTMLVPNEWADEAQKDQTVTVYYDPLKPQSSLIYEVSPYVLDAVERFPLVQQ